MHFLHTLLVLFHCFFHAVVRIRKVHRLEEGKTADFVRPVEGRILDSKRGS